MVSKIKAPAVLAMILFLALGAGLVLSAGPALADTQNPPPPKGQGESGASGQEPPAALYYDFSDVLIPRQLTLKRDESFVYDTSSFTAGFLTFEGRVEVRSLTQFFVDAMSQDNWLLGAKFTHKEVVLLFEKPNKRTMMYITETRFKTKVRIWVAPFLGSKK